MSALPDIHVHIHHDGHVSDRAACACQIKLDLIIQKINTMSDTIESKAASIEAKLVEASGEIIADLAFLRAQVPVTPEALAALDRIEAIASALASVSPSVSTTPPEDPNESPAE